MRLFLLPISTKRSLIYCQRLNNQLSSETTYVDKITARASATWLKWEKAESGWQKKVTAYGNKLFERIPHEEWGLKSVPPLSRRREDEELKGGKEVQVQYPGSLINEEGVKEALKTFAGAERQSFHTKWMWGSIIGMPISAPVALLPVIPNLPFFYLVFRAWSHWKGRQLVRLTTSSNLDLAYAFGRMDASMKEIASEVKGALEGSSNIAPGVEPAMEAERMLLTQSSGRIIADVVEVPELEEHIQRAVKQVEKALRGKKELQEEKQELDKVNKEAKEEAEIKR
ncbi:MAG: hypothetical protein LQ350_003183 [Teloschistes chrysophthalmus]|nr:MAG: hypothetical protein LQ350_003183 [Niorma chrysophthalma]